MSLIKQESMLHGIVKQMMKERNIEDFEFKIDGGTGNADGYMGEIVFFHVIINKDKILNLVLKAEKPQEKLKTLIGSDILCGIELKMYTMVIPALENFAKAKKFKELSKFIPQLWFGGKQFDQVNIVLENLKLQNFHIQERTKPMKFSHMKLLFETFGKWHGISMAFKDQHPEKFSKLAGNWPDPRARFIQNFGFLEQYKKELNVIQRMLVERGRSDLAKIYEGVKDKIRQVLLRENMNEKDLLVISHGDNWITNYMFKYQDCNENTTPNQVLFIDFQLSRLDSPAYELSSSLYNMGDRECLDKFEDLLWIYHEQLSRTLKSLGSNANDLFTMDDLKKHWRKYSLASVLHVFAYLRIALCDPSEAPDLAKMAENGGGYEGAFDFEIKEMDTFWKRALEVFIHFGDFLQTFSTY